MSQRNRASAQAAEWARKKKAQQERARQLRAERQAKARGAGGYSDHAAAAPRSFRGSALPSSPHHDSLDDAFPPAGTGGHGAPDPYGAAPPRGGGKKSELDMLHEAYDKKLKRGGGGGGRSYAPPRRAPAASSTPGGVRVRIGGPGMAPTVTRFDGDRGGRGRRGPGSGAGAGAGAGGAAVARRGSAGRAGSAIVAGNGAGTGPGRYSAARSHEATNAYMNEFHRAHDEMVVAAGGTVAARGRRGRATTGVGAGAEGSVHRVLAEVTNGWYTGPVDPAGVLMDCSDRGIICMDVHDREVAFGCSDHGVYTYDINSGKKRRTLYTKRCGHSEWVTCLTYLPDGRLVSGGMDNKLCLWAATGASCRDMVGHTSSVSVVKASASGGMVVSGGYDRTVRCWDTRRGAEVCALTGGHSGPVLDLALLPGTVVSGGRDSKVLLWDLETGKCRRSLTGHKGHITAVEWFADAGEAGDGSQLVLSGAQDGHLRVWDLRSQSCVANVPAHTSDSGSGAVGSIACTAMSASALGGLAGDMVVTIGADKAVVVSDPRRNFEPLRRWTEHREFPYSLTVAGPLVFSGDGAGMLLAHDIDSGKLLYGLGANEGAVRCLGAVGDKLVAAGDDGNGLVFTFR